MHCLCFIATENQSSAPSILCTLCVVGPRKSSGANTGSGNGNSARRLAQTIRVPSLATTRSTCITALRVILLSSAETVTSRTSRVAGGLVVNVAKARIIVVTAGSTLPAAGVRLTQRCANTRVVQPAITMFGLTHSSRRDHLAMRPRKQLTRENVIGTS